MSASTVRLIDTHAHLDEDAFIGERDDVIGRARDAGLEAVLTIGTTAASSRTAIEIAEANPDIYAVVGIQPNYVSEAAEGDWDSIVEMARHDKVVAVGETGLDRYWDFAPFDLQLEYFRKHVDLAQELKVPFIIHCRDAEADVVEFLRQTHDRTGSLVGVMHSFCGDQATADSCLEMGMYISFAGMVTFKRNNELRELAATIPAERLLIETDSPYLSPIPLRGKRNEPAHVEYTARCLAEVRGVSYEAIAETTAVNARRLFGLPGST